jgi:hypothetical protein
VPVLAEKSVWVGIKPYPRLLLNRLKKPALARVLETKLGCILFMSLQSLLMNKTVLKGKSKEKR